MDSARGAFRNAMYKLHHTLFISSIKLHQPRLVSPDHLVAFSDDTAEWTKARKTEESTVERDQRTIKGVRIFAATMTTFIAIAATDAPATARRDV